MSLAPTTSELQARARSDLRSGVGVVLSLGPASLLIGAAETIHGDRLVDFRTFGEPVLTITQRRAETLKIRCYDGDIARITLPADADTTWIGALADPADDLRVPMKGPVTAIRGDNADMHRAAIALVKEARLLPAVLAVEITDAAQVAAKYSLTHIDLASSPVTPATQASLNRIVSAHVPLQVSQTSRLHVFRPEDGGEEHYAIEIGRPDRSNSVLTRLHSACFTGDLLGSLKCDCGPQLRAALQQMGQAGSGVLLYLNQEGRGIGLANKMRAYSLQDQGFDTVQANHRLGFEDDERDFRLGSDILTSLGVSSVELLTNNPAKVARMQENGIQVAKRIPLIVGENALNTEYLKTKAKKSGHIL